MIDPSLYVARLGTMPDRFDVDEHISNSVHFAPDFVLHFICGSTSTCIST
jgi:hypothetical protein